MTTPSIEPLMDMGLTGLEAEAYVYLLHHAPATGYGVAKGLRKPTANTYKAMESLFERGAVIREEGGNREYRPVAPGELLGALERQFLARKKRASAELQKLHDPPQDDRVYRLQTVDQVLERMRAMLTRAQCCAVLDLFPWSADVLAEDIEVAAGRGVDVTVKLYCRRPLRGARVEVDARGEEVLERWPGQWCNGVVDGQEHQLAWLSPDGSRVLQAVWSQSPFLSWAYHSALISEVTCSLIETTLERSEPTHELLEEIRALRRLAHSDDAPGYMRLLDSRNHPTGSKPPKDRT